MFSLFGGSATNPELGVVVDISDAEVSVAIVLAKEGEPSPKVLWHTRELVSGVAESGTEEARVKAAIIKAFASLGTAGLQALRQQGISDLPELIQASISAPFAYTISRSVKVVTEKPFKVTTKFISELEKKATTEAAKESRSNLMIKDLKLVTLANSTAGLSINGYVTRYPFKSFAKEVLLCQIVTLAPEELLAEIVRQRDKILPKAHYDVDSFMSIYLRALVSTTSELNEACLVNITANHAEMMLVRDRLPMSSTYVKLPARFDAVADAEKGYQTCQQVLTDLFKKSGDGLAMPRLIYVHADNNETPALKTCLETASKAATGINHQVSLTGKEFFEKDPNIPSFLAIEAHVFHKDLYEDKYLEDYRNVLK